MGDPIPNHRISLFIVVRCPSDIVACVECEKHAPATTLHDGWLPLTLLEDIGE